MSNIYLSEQLNGQYCQAVMNGILQSFQATDELLSYWNNLSIDTSYDNEIENFLGLLVGYPRPFVDSSLISGNEFLLGSIVNNNALLNNALPISPLPEDLTATVFDSNHGLSSLSNLTSGGLLSSLGSTGIKLPLAIYQAVLKKIAYIKYNGLTIVSIDNLMQLAGVSYTITYDSNQNIVITFASAVSEIYIYIFEVVFEIFATLPQFSIVQL